MAAGESKTVTLKLEQNTIPALIDGKLLGVRLGVAIVGTLPEGMTESLLLTVTHVNCRHGLPLDVVTMSTVPDNASRRGAFRLMGRCFSGTSLSRLTVWFSFSAPTWTRL